MRRRLYGLAVLVTLSFLIIARSNDSQDFAPMHLPLAGASMLMLCMAGAELTCYIHRLATERRATAAQAEREEQSAVGRQRTFNRMWQELADSRGAAKVPESVLTELQSLFGASLVAAWSGDKMSGFHLAGAHPVSNDIALRLDRVAQMSPCFERLSQSQRLMCVNDFALDTSKAFGWFCEEGGYQHVVLCPVLVRHDLVGVLAFFYPQKPRLSSRMIEEMQSAANLFLCAF